LNLNGREGGGSEGAGGQGITSKPNVREKETPQSSEGKCPIDLRRREGKRSKTRGEGEIHREKLSAET